jgi:putative membrane protein
MSQENETLASQDKERAEAARIIRKLGIYALVRTAFSSERSLMSWIRTSVSMYAFGFTVSKFGRYMGQQHGSQFSTGPRRLGLALISIGILSLVLAAIGHLQRLKKMKRLGLPTVSLISLPVIATAVLLLIGITVLISIGLN